MTSKLIVNQLYVCYCKAKLPTASRSGKQQCAYIAVIHVYLCMLPFPHPMHVCVCVCVCVCTTRPEMYVPLAVSTYGGTFCYS